MLCLLFLPLVFSVPIAKVTEHKAEGIKDKANALYRHFHNPSNADLRSHFWTAASHFRFTGPKSPGVGAAIGAPTSMGSLPDPANGNCLELFVGATGNVVHDVGTDSWRLNVVTCPVGTVNARKINWVPYEEGKCVVKKLDPNYPVWVTYEMSGCANYIAEMPGHDPYILHCNANDVSAAQQRIAGGLCFQNNVLLPGISEVNCAGAGGQWEEYCLLPNGAHDTQFTPGGCQNQNGTWFGWSSSLGGSDVLHANVKGAGLVHSDIAKMNRGIQALADINALEVANGNAGAAYTITGEVSRSMYMVNFPGAGGFGWGRLHNGVWENYVHTWQNDPSTRPRNIPFAPPNAHLTG